MGTQAAQTHVDVPPLPMLVVPDPKPQCWTLLVKPSSQVPLLLGDHVAPTVRGEVVGHIFTQAHSPGTLLELVRNGIADLAAPSCVGRETPPPVSQPCLSLLPSPCSLGLPQPGLGPKGFSAQKRRLQSPTTMRAVSAGMLGKICSFLG